MGGWVESGGREDSPIGVYSPSSVNNRYLNQFVEERRLFDSRPTRTDLGFPVELPTILLHPTPWPERPVRRYPVRPREVKLGGSSRVPPPPLTHYREMSTSFTRTLQFCVPKLGPRRTESDPREVLRGSGWGPRLTCARDLSLVPGAGATGGSVGTVTGEGVTGVIGGDSTRVGSQPPVDDGRALRRRTREERG